MHPLLQILETVLTNFWGVIGVLGLSFGLIDLLKHLGNRLDKRRGMEIYRELMKERFGLMNTAVQFGADAVTLAELNKLLERHGNLNELKQLVGLQVKEDSENSHAVMIKGLDQELHAVDLASGDGDKRKSRQVEG